MISKSDAIKLVAAILVVLAMIVMSLKERPVEVTLKPKCRLKGYTLLGDGKAVTNCGDTIVKHHYRP